MIILALQFHNADKPQAMRLARLIADLEEIPRDDVEFLFVARYDTEQDADTMEYVRKKFPRVSAFTSTTRLTGWPQGPNALVKDLLLSLDHRTAVDGVLLIEPDCVPLSRHWLNILFDEWGKAILDRKVMLGAWRNSGAPGGHINGNAIIISALPSWLRSCGFEFAQVDQLNAWDCAISPWVREHWATTGRIKNRFQSHNATEDDLLTPDVGDEQPVLVHGYKDDSAYNLARKLLKLE